MFLLSIDEVNRFFKSDDARVCIPTEIMMTLYHSSYVAKSGCWWWLRSPGKDANHAASVALDGPVYSDGLRVRNGYAVRPVVALQCSNE